MELQNVDIFSGIDSLNLHILHSFLLAEEFLFVLFLLWESSRR